MTEKSMYAEQNEAQECRHSREVGIIAQDSQGAA
jgi:hypothetical protein